MHVWDWLLCGTTLMTVGALTPSLLVKLYSPFLARLNKALFVCLKIMKLTAGDINS